MRHCVYSAILGFHQHSSERQLLENQSLCDVSFLLRNQCNSILEHKWINTHVKLYKQNCSYFIGQHHLKRNVWMRSAMSVVCVCVCAYTMIRTLTAEFNDSQHVIQWRFNNALADTRDQWLLCNYAPLHNATLKRALFKCSHSCAHPSWTI